MTFPPAPGDAAAAQRRADRVRGFRQELADAEQDLGPLLSAEARGRLEAYHDALVDRLRTGWEIDTTEQQHRLSLGMRAASFLGAVALCAAVFLFFARYWNRWPAAPQIAVLIAGPLAGLALTEFAARRERTLYFASLAGLVTCAAFVVALMGLGRLYNMPDSPYVWLAWGAFGLTLAHAYGFRLVLLAAIPAASVFPLGLAASLTGAWWPAFMGRPEGIMLAGLCWLGWPALRPPAHPGFAPIYRVTGAVLVLLSLMALGLNGDLSLLPLARKPTEVFYDVLGLAAAAGGMVLGVRRRWLDLHVTCLVGFILLMLVKAFDWWWAWMSGELFFLLLGLMALATLTVLRRYRTRAM